MNCEEAKKILNMNSNSYEELRKKYKRQSLLHHPDKRGNTEDFLKVKEAYEVLLANVEKPDNNKPSTYIFLRDHLSSMSLNDLKNIYTMFCNGEKYELLMKFQEFLISNRDRINLNDQLIRIFEHMNQRKEKKVIILQPTLNDMMDTNVYKLVLDDEVVNVPLWHEELLYDIKNTEYLIKMIPDLDEHVVIMDDCLIFNLSYNINDIWNKEQVFFHEKLWFNRDRLLLKNTQKLVLYNMGLPNINTKNVYDVNKRGDIVLNVTLFM